MDKNHEISAKIFKALSDSSRLKILDILSCGQKFACDILEHFNFTQPAVFRHINIIEEEL